MMAKIFLLVLLIFYSTKSSSAALDLGDACQKMWDKAADNLKVPSEVKIDTVGKVILESAAKAKVDASDVFKKFKELVTSTTTQNMNAFFNATTQQGGPLEQALSYLNTNVFDASKKTIADFKTILKEAWFEPFPGKGFKHVFVGEKRVIKKKNVYSGFHNWYQFYLQQVQNEISDVQLDSFTNNTKPSFIRMNFKWDKATKRCPSSMYVGTSPAFDFALFSTCFITLYKGPSGGKLGNECTCKIDNSNLTIKAIEKPTGSGKICTAYPTKIISATSSPTASPQTCCEMDDCLPSCVTPTTTTTPPTTSGGGKVDYYVKKGCFLVFYFCYFVSFY